MGKKLKKQGNRKKSIDRTYQFKICLWLALRKTTAQIIDLLKDRLDITMTAQNIDHNYRYSKKWKPVISYLRERFLRNIARIPIANKAHRLWLLDEAAVEALTWHTKSISQWGIVKEKKVGIIPSLTKEARIEIEGEKLIDNSKHNHYLIVGELHKLAKGDNGKPEVRPHARAGLSIVE